jgi:membrane protease YdiL (CAAX protease family)
MSKDSLTVSGAKGHSAREILLFIVCFSAVWTVRATYLYAIDDSIASDTLRTVYSVTVKLILWAVPAFAFACWVRHASPFRYLGLSVMPSARQWIKYLVVIGLFLSALIGFEIIVGGKQLSLAGIPSSLTLAAWLSIAASAFIEELLFRGLLLHDLAALLPRWGANLLTSLLFAGIHLPFWLSHGGMSGALLINAGGVFIFSLLAGWLYLDSSSIWPSTLAHIANNCVAALLVG